MPNHQSTRNAPYTISSSSSSLALESMYGGRAGNWSNGKALPRQGGAHTPDAIWGQFNNYRSNGLMGSAVIHLVAVGLLVSGITFGHQVVEQVQKHEQVTLIAPSPESYAMPVAKKVV